MNANRKKQQEEKILIIEIGRAYLELAGKMGDSVYETASRIDAMMDQIKQDHDLLIAAQFDLIVEVCTNSMDSMNDDQLCVALEYVLKTGVENR